MASWSDRVSRMTQNAISKSKEVAGITKLNMEISSLNQEIKALQTQVGAYVLENGFLLEDSFVGETAEKAEALKREIDEKSDKIMELKNVTICTGCGREVSRNSRFCDSCGAEVVIKVHGADVTEPEKTDGGVVVTEITPENAAGNSQAGQEGTENGGGSSEPASGENGLGE